MSQFAIYNEEKIESHKIHTGDNYTSLFYFRIIGSTLKAYKELYTRYFT
ncbi:hypothetical protein M2373_002974 [Chryseobacterium sp. JUb7]|nr:hypothetical protein [Chryseobacterium sp. JUb7]